MPGANDPHDVRTKARIWTFEEGKDILVPFHERVRELVEKNTHMFEAIKDHLEKLESISSSGSELSSAADVMLPYCRAMLELQEGSDEIPGNEDRLEHFVNGAGYDLQQIKPVIELAEDSPEKDAIAAAHSELSALSTRFLELVINRKIAAASHGR